VGVQFAADVDLVVVVAGVWPATSIGANEAIAKAPKDVRHRWRI
jgi:hypothetical protein